MRKGILVLLLVLFLVPSSFATLTKLYTMGAYGFDAYTGYAAGTFVYMKDDANLRIWPQLITEYPGLLLYEHPNYDWGYYGAGGITWGFGANDVVGLFVSNDYYSMFDFYPYDKFTLIYGHNFDNFKLGFAFNWAGDKYETEDAWPYYDGTYEEKISIMAFTGGATFNVGEGHSVDLAATYKKTSFSVDSSSTEFVKSDAGTTFDVVARFNYQFNEKTRLVPAFEFLTEKIGYRDVFGGGDTTDYSHNLFHIGIGCNYKPHDKVELINALGMVIDKNKWEDLASDETGNTTYNTLPYFMLGADINLKSWLNLRFGLNKWLTTYKYEYEDTYPYSYKYGDSDFDYVVGA